MAQKKIKQDLQHPNWWFTFNYGKEDQPPVEAALRFVNETLPSVCDYLIAGFEESPTTGQPHIQGYAQLNKRKRLTELKKLPDAGTVHWEPAKGDEIQNREYCTKSCGDDFVEFGEAKCVNGRIQEKKRWDDAKQLAKSGAIDEVCAQIYVSHYSSLRNIARDHLGCSADEEEVTGIWVYGDSGSGKSHWARNQYGGGTDKLYLKPINKWWDGFRKDQHENVLLEDMEPSQSCLGYHLKIWADKYSFPAEIKGSTIQIRPKRIIVTSQYHPAQIWTDMETQTAILRRFRVLKKSTKESSPEIENLTEPQLRGLIFNDPNETKTETTSSANSSAATNVCTRSETRSTETAGTLLPAKNATNNSAKASTSKTSPEPSQESSKSLAASSQVTDEECDLTTENHQPILISTDLLDLARTLARRPGILDLVRALGPQDLTD